VTLEGGGGGGGRLCGGGTIAGFGGLVCEIGDWRLEIGGGVVSGMGMGMGIFVVRRAVLLNGDMNTPCGGRRMGFR